MHAFCSFDKNSFVIAMLQVYNMLFDIFNSRNLKCLGDKKPISAKNMDEVFNKLRDGAAYLRSLNLPGGLPLYSSRRYVKVPCHLLYL